ncbi:MAG: hypothetical protein GY851_30590 [bacterium]|nr:hypothetical protein [bacterium]
MAGLRAGFAERTITPAVGAALAGYFEPHVADTIVNDLWVSAAVFKDDAGNAVALASCDVIALDADTVAAIRGRVEETAGIGPDSIMVCAVHNHTGPQTVDLLGGRADPTYLMRLEETMAEAIAAAAGDCGDVAVHYGSAQVNGLSCNRRLVFGDGSVHTHVTGADESEAVGREGPCDRELSVLTAVRPSGEVAGCVANFALHATNVRGDRICSDYPRHFTESLRASTGGGYPVVYLNGACGNIDSKAPELHDVEYGPGRAQRIGTELAEAAAPLLEGGGETGASTVAAAAERIAIPVRKVSAEEVERAREALSRTQPAELWFTRRTRRPSAVKEAVYAREVLALVEAGASKPSVDAEAQVLRVGDVAIVGVPVELFSEFGLAMKECGRDAFRGVMVAGLANGYLGYVPTAQAFEGGGYETRLARSSQLVPEAGDCLVQTVMRLMCRV